MEKKWNKRHNTPKSKLLLLRIVEENGRASGRRRRAAPPPFGPLMWRLERSIKAGPCHIWSTQSQSNCSGSLSLCLLHCSRTKQHNPSLFFFPPFSLSLVLHCISFHLIFHFKSLGSLSHVLFRGFCLSLSVCWFFFFIEKQKTHFPFLFSYSPPAQRTQQHDTRERWKVNPVDPHPTAKTK